MAESRLVPSNLMSGSRIRNCLPDQKLIVYHMWATSTSDAGCYEPDIAGWSGHLSITIPALLEALVDFETKKLILQDKETGEIFILDWFRYHKFDSAIRRNLLDSSMRKIQSKKLLDLVIEKKEQIDAKNNVIPTKSDTCSPKQSKGNETSSCTHAEDIPTCVHADEKEEKKVVNNSRKISQIICGVKCWHPDDVINTEIMVKEYGAEKVIIAANKLIENGLKPLPSKVENELVSMVRNDKFRGSNAKKFNTADDFPTPKKPLIPRGSLKDLLNAASSN